jgi:hypothetical protein
MLSATLVTIVVSGAHYVFVWAHKAIHARRRSK